MRFLRLSGNSRCVRKAQNGGHLPSSNLVTDSDDDDDLQSIDSNNACFKHDGALCKVTRKDREANSIWVFHPTKKQELRLDYDRALEIVNTQFGRQ